MNSLLDRRNSVYTALALAAVVMTTGLFAETENVLLVEVLFWGGAMFTVGFAAYAYSHAAIHGPEREGPAVLDTPPPMPSAQAISGEDIRELQRAFTDKLDKLEAKLTQGAVSIDPSPIRPIPFASRALLATTRVFRSGGLAFGIAPRHRWKKELRLKAGADRKGLINELHTSLCYSVGQLEQMEKFLPLLPPVDIATMQDITLRAHFNSLAAQGLIPYLRFLAHSSPWSVPGVPESSLPRELSLMSDDGVLTADGVHVLRTLAMAYEWVDRERPDAAKLQGFHPGSSFLS